MSDNRKPREAESRELAQRPEAWKPPEVLPEPNPRPGWTHRWVRISMQGNSDPGNIASKLREGYEPVRAEEYPEMMMHATEEGRFKGGIEVGGCCYVVFQKSLLVNVMHITTNRLERRWNRLTIRSCETMILVCLCLKTDVAR